MPKPPTPLTGALVGALLTATLTAVFYAAHHLAGVAFPPFQVFDRMGRALPGAVITFGIDTMVGVIRTLRIGATSDVAKLAEQTMAVAGLLVTGAFAGALVFGLLRRQPSKRDSSQNSDATSRRALTIGLFAGAVIGLAVAATVTTSSTPGPAGPVVGAVWTFAAFLSWGATLAWGWRRLDGLARSTAPVGQALVIPGSQDLTIAGGERPVAVIGVGRRAFLIRFGGATAVITVAGAVVGRLLSRGEGGLAADARWSMGNALPNAGARVEPARGTRPEFTALENHYRIDINTAPPVLDDATWRLRFGGRVLRPIDLTLADLRGRYEPIHQFVTLACISNPVAGDLTSTTRWTGASLSAVLEDVGLQADATHLRLRSADGFDEVLDLAVVRADPPVMLTYAWDGVPLPQRHGFPLRVYIPDRYGMKQPKWIEEIEAIAAWDAGYWVRRGWDREARMRATSVIDTVAADMMVIDAETQAMRVPIGGIAHAGARGILRVDVRVDDGPWEPASLRTPLSSTTWVIWRYDWPFAAGEHRFTVRCTDGEGTPQIVEPSSVRPSGATGLYHLDRMV